MSDATDWEFLLTQQIRQSGRLFFSLAHGLLRENDAAEDVVQQALLQAWEHRFELQDTTALRSWLCKVVLNESLRLCRRKRIEIKSGAARMFSHNFSGAQPHHGVDLRDSIASALERLPQAVREIVVLRIMEGISGCEVARMLESSPATVSRQLTLGMERLRDYLADWKFSGA